MPADGRLARLGGPLPVAAAVSLGLHGAAIAAAILLWRPAPGPQIAAISVELVTPQDMPAPALVRAREALSVPPPAAAELGAVAKADTAIAPPESVSPVREPRHAEAVRRPRGLEMLGQPKTKSVEPARPAAAASSPAAPPPARAQWRPEVSLELARPAPAAGSATAKPPPARAQWRPEVSLELARPAPAAGPAAAKPMTAGPAAAKPMTAVRAVTPVRKAPRFAGAGLANPAPRYPYLARRRGQEGRVILRVLVSALGDAKAVSIRRSSGYRLLDEAALTAVSAWRFVPASDAERPVAGALDVPIWFRLTQ